MSKTPPVNEAFETALAELEDIIEEMEASDSPPPTLPGLPRPPGLLARLFAPNPTRH